MRTAITVLGATLAAACATSRAAAAILFVDGGCATSGSGASLACGASGPFRTIGECIVAMNPGRSDQCDVRGSHGAEPSRRSDAFDGFYFEELWMDQAPPAGVRGKPLPCAPGRCIIQGCRATDGCPADERPTIRGMSLRAWTSLGGGVWSRVMEATPEPGRSGSNTNRAGPAGDHDPYQLFEDDGGGYYSLAYAGDGVAAPADGQWSFDPATLTAYVHPTGGADPNTAVWVPYFSDLAWASSPSSNVTLQYLDFVGSRTVGLDLGEPPVGSLPGFELHHLGVGHLRRMGIHCQDAPGIVFDDLHLFNLGRGESFQGTDADSTYGIRCFHIDGFTMQDVLVEGIANAGQVNLSHSPPRPPGHPCSWCTPPWNDPAHTWASNQSNAVQIKQTAGGTMTRVHVRDSQGQAIDIDCSRNITITASDATDTGGCVGAWSFTPDPATGFHWWSGLTVDGFTCVNAGVNDVQHCAMNFFGGNATERDAGSKPWLVHLTNSFINGVGFAGICLDTGPNQATSPSDVAIAYNSINRARVTKDADAGARGIVINAATKNVVLQDNIVAGVSDEQIVVVGRASAATFDHDLLDPSTPPSCAFRWGGATIAPGSPPAGGTCGTLAAYRAATGEEMHGLEGDAAFVSPTDDHILGISAARDAGSCVPALTTVDHDGGARPFGPTCDIGAHEFGSTPPALATVDRCLRGAALVLRDTPGRPARRRFLLRSTDRARLDLGSSADVAALIAQGGTLTVVATGGDAFSVTYPLPASGWRLLRRRHAGAGIRYRDRAGPVTAVVFRTRRLLEVSGRGPGLVQSLGSEPGVIAVELRIGGHRYGLAFGGDRHRFLPNRALVRRDAARPSACPVVQSTGGM